MFSLPAASRILAHMWKEKSSLCLSNNPRHVYLKVTQPPCSNLVLVLKHDEMNDS